MSVFSVPVTIGVDEAKIAKEIEANVERQVVENITNDVKNVMFKSSGYYGRGNLDDPEPTREMVRAEIAKIVSRHEDDIIKMAAELLADKLSRAKRVKEAAMSVASKVNNENE